MKIAGKDLAETVPWSALAAGVGGLTCAGWLKPVLETNVGIAVTQASTAGRRNFPGMAPRRGNADLVRPERFELPT